MHNKPFGLLNTDGYYDPLIAMLDRMVSEGFVSPAVRALLLVGTDAAELLGRLHAAASVKIQG